MPSHPSRMQGLDHIALGVVELDERIAFFTQVLGLELRRMGTRHATGRRIAMLADPLSGFKIELIETSAEEEGLLHLAARVEDVEAAYQELQAKGLRAVREPHELAAAKAKTALLEDGSALGIQIIRYQPDSPDL